MAGDCGTTKNSAMVCSELAASLLFKWFFGNEDRFVTTRCQLFERDDQF